MSQDPAQGLTIGAVAARTGLSVPVLRAWEERFGFPAPQRLPSGHRRYTEQDLIAIERVVAERASGRSLETAIDAARQPSHASGLDAGTVFAGLRALRPELPVTVLGRRGMLALSRAVEEECLASSARPRITVAFQEADRWRTAQSRWEPLTRLATSTTVFADFAESQVSGSTAEVAIEPHTPMAREWSVLFESTEFSAVLAGWERPDGRFEALWTVDSGAVRTAFAVADGLARLHAPRLPPRPAPPMVPVRSERSLTARAEAIASRALSRLGT